MVKKETDDSKYFFFLFLTFAICLLNFDFFSFYPVPLLPLSPFRLIGPYKPATYFSPVILGRKQYAAPRVVTKSANVGSTAFAPAVGN